MLVRVVAAIALVAAPAIIGRLILRDDGGVGDSHMAGAGMGQTATTATVGRDPVSLVGVGDAEVLDMDEILATRNRNRVQPCR